MANKVTLRNTLAIPAAADSPDATADRTRRYEIDVMALMRLLLRNRRWIIWPVGVMGVLTALVLFLMPNRYTSTAVILPSGKSDNLTAIKAITGLSNLFGSGDVNSSALFPLILSSNLVRDAVLDKVYSFSHDGEQMHLSLKDYIGIDNPDRLRRALGRMTAISSDSRTGEIALAVETKYPELSQAVVREYLDQLESYNLHKRKSSASENARYLERQVTEARLALDDAETTLETFRSHNAAWLESTSPEVLTQVGRLTREVQIRSSAYLLLQEQYELAKIDAQKDVPIISLLDEPSLPTEKSGPFRALILLATMTITCVLAVIGILTKDMVGQFTAGPRGESGEALTNDVAAAFPRTVRTCQALRTRLTKDTTDVTA